MTDLEFANSPAEVFTTSEEALADLDARRDAELEKMEEEAKELMALDQDDPRTHSYFMRMDRKTIVRNEKEYIACQLNGVPVKIVPYPHALQLLKEEDARHRNKIKARKKRKTAKASRKRNR